MDKRKLGYSIASVLIIAFVASYFTAFGANSLFQSQQHSPSLTDVLNYHSLVTVTYTPLGGIPRIVSSHHNFFSAAGQDMVFDLLTRTQPAGGTATVGNVTQILLCNDTNSAGCVQTYFDSGLTNVTGTVTRISAGNWSIVKTFTSTANSKDVNATALFNGTVTAATYFAGNNFTKVTLQNGDALTITWNISVS